MSDDEMQDDILWPPGFAAHLTQHIYENSFIRIPEIAVCATVALLAGVTGRGYRTPTGKDLSQYMILVAPTGIGKDAIHTGIPRLLHAHGYVIPDAEKLIRREDFVSGAALHATLLLSPGFLNLQGEFGRKLKRMANPGDTPMQELRTKMTRAYGVEYMEAKVHSDPDKTIQGVYFPAFSFLGETTPQTFLDLLTDDMMEDGFLARFLIVSYFGDRPRANHNQTAELEPDAKNYWAGMLVHCGKFTVRIPNDPPIWVTYQPEAKYVFDEFEEECRTFMNEAGDNNLQCAIWNRAHLKALKVASSLAVADNYLAPVMSVKHAEWAIEFIQRDVNLFKRREQEGHIGNDDAAREKQVIKILREYIRNSEAIPGSYGVKAAMVENSIVPTSYLQNRTSGLSAFKQHKLGATEALRHVLRSLCDGSYLMEVQKNSLSEHYNYHGKAYRILNLPPERK